RVRLDALTKQAIDDLESEVDACTMTDPFSGLLFFKAQDYKIRFLTHFESCVRKITRFRFQAFTHTDPSLLNDRGYAYEWLEAPVRSVIANEILYNKPSPPNFPNPRFRTDPEAWMGLEIEEWVRSTVDELFARAGLGRGRPNQRDRSQKIAEIALGFGPSW